MDFVLYVRRFPFHLNTLGSQGSESHARADVQGSNYGLVDKSSIDREMQSLRFIQWDKLPLKLARD